MTEPQTVHIVDDDDALSDSLSWLMESIDLQVNTYASAQAFLQVSSNAAPGCVLLDIRLRDMSGLELQRRLLDRGFRQPIIVMTGHGDIGTAVEAMKNGALDFVTKPFDDRKLLNVVQNALDQARVKQQKNDRCDQVATRFASLSRREREVLDRVVAGKLNKVIAAEMAISDKTVEAHRARVMKKMQARNLADLIRQITLLEPDN